MVKPDLLLIGRYPEWDEAPLAEAYQLHRLPEDRTRADFLAEVGPRLRAIATNAAQGADRALIAACPRLEMVAIYGVGLDAVDLAACALRGIKVTNTPDVLTEDVADMAVAMALSQIHGLAAADGLVRSGAWAGGARAPLRRRLSARRVGILGLGRIGRLIGQRLAGFGMAIAYSARSDKALPAWRYIADPVELARWADVLVLALSASAQSRHIVDAEVLRALGPDGILVNISRGSNVDEEALIAALKNGTIAGAALDVFANEPRIDPRFAELDNVLLQPHHASATIEARRSMGELWRSNLAAHFAGAPLPSPVL